MKKSNFDETGRLMFAINLPRVWDLPITRFSDLNESLLHQKYKDGTFKMWPLKAAVWGQRVSKAQYGECDLALCYADDRVPFTILEPSALAIREVTFDVNFKMRVRVSYNEWVEVGDIQKTAKYMGFPNEVVYKAYLSRYVKAYQSCFLLMWCDVEDLLNLNEYDL